MEYSEEANICKPLKGEIYIEKMAGGSGLITFHHTEETCNSEIAAWYLEALASNTFLLCSIVCVVIFNTHKPCHS